MDILLILLALGLLIAGAWRGVTVLVLAPGLATGLALASGLPMLAAYTQVFMAAAGGFVTAFLPLFLLGAVFGRVMDDSGSAARLAAAIATGVGERRAVLAVVLACAVLTYGGVSLFVVAFVAWPLARALFARAGTPARLIPATIALGAFTFTMTALPGSPAIQNAIPMPFFGTTLFAAPGLGVLAGAVMAGFGLAWLSFRAARLGPGPEDAALADPAAAPTELALWRAIVPVALVLAVTLALGWALLRVDTAYLAEARWGATDIARLRGLWAVIGALVVAIAAAFMLSQPADPVATLNAGATAALLPLFNTASLVGFGAVVAALPGFEALRQGLEALTGGSVLWSLALVVNVLAGITGSASGGLSIALDAFGAQAQAAAAAQGIDPGVLHRLVAVATGGLDALPHNGAVVTLLGICGMTHGRAYGDIFMVAVVGPLLAMVVLILAAGAFGAF
ncbi:MAG TPA: GntP family permease [Paracoccaceae bacterium]|nr:GntP family permease [Paracoccaceae bacterium]HMO71460.1 GntP family permease [Paracoccaceae bacterium]